jgi:hypothetical protein
MKNFKILFSFLIFSTLLTIFSSCNETKKEENRTAADAVDKSGNLSIGWAQADITPDKPVLIAGQFHARVSEGVMDPVTATVLVLESGSGESSEKVFLISCDLVGISDGTRDDPEGNLRNTIREKITGKIPEVSPEKIFINATHTHTAPYCNTAISSQELYGVELEVMSPAECIQFVAGNISEAAEQAWETRIPGGISFGLGHAVVGHNRLQTDINGNSQMYGNTDKPEFSHIEGYEDHSVNLLYTWDKQDNLTGVVVNVPCPSQVTEGLFVISADYWHDTRVEIRKRLGEDIFILPQCGPAGDQSPHIMIGERAEARMQKLKFPELEKVGDRTAGLRKDIAVRIADAVTSVLPYMKNSIDWNPTLKHKLEIVELSRRLIGPEDVNEGMRESEKWKKEYNKLLDEIKENPALKEKPRWYTPITIAHTRMRRGNNVRDRYELEKVQPKMPVEVHILRVGDIVIATNPFEYYLDYGMRIKARSSAIQTFLVQLTGSGSYIPTIRSIEGGAYGAVPASTLIGPEGGQELVERTLELIEEIMN